MSYVANFNDITNWNSFNRTSDFLEQIIILKSFDSVLFVATDKNKNKKTHSSALIFKLSLFSESVKIAEKISD